MTDREKKQEEKVFKQEISQEELESVAGGDCGRPEYMNGPCPKGAAYIQRCPNNASNLIALEDLLKPVTETPVPEVPFSEDKQ